VAGVNCRYGPLECFAQLTPNPFFAPTWKLLKSLIAIKPDPSGESLAPQNNRFLLFTHCFSFIVYHDLMLDKEDEKGTGVNGASRTLTFFWTTGSGYVPWFP